jgi:hypothetical protein
MIKKFIGEVRVGLLSILQPRGPVWLTSWYWLDRLDEWRDQHGPRRPVSRFKVVRYAKASFHLMGLFGWLWAGLATAGLFWLTKGAGFANYLVAVGTVLAAIRVGIIWARRNLVMQIEWEDECPCRQWEADL